MKSILLICCWLSCSFSGYSHTKDTFEVHFPFNISKLSKDAAAYIDRLIFKDTLIRGDKLIVLGYTDYVGGNSYNDTLSMLRAKSVLNYLVKSGFAENDIKLCIGKGKIDRKSVAGKDGYAPDRKVQIIIDRVTKKSTPFINTPVTSNHDENKDLAHLKVNETFALTNIYFKLNSPILLDKSQPDLQRLLDFLKRYPSVKIQIEGHVCCMGPAEGTDSKYKGEPLSELRAKAIYNYLVEKGINKERMKYVGLANRNPIVPQELTEEDRIKNRRVEIRILSK